MLSETAFVEAADEARVPLERDLHDGAQQRLLAIGIALNLIEDQPVDDLLLANANEEVACALSELLALAAAIHPAVLTDPGPASRARCARQTHRPPRHRRRPANRAGPSAPAIEAAA